MGIAIAIVVVIALAVVALLVTARSRATTGRVSRETRKRDEAAGASTPNEAIRAQRRDHRRRRVEGRSGSRRRGRLSRASPSRAPPQVGPRRAVEPATPAVYEPVDLDELGVTRRQFFNRSILAGSGLGLGAFGVAALAFLWPGASTGFGGKIVVGSVADANTAIGNKMPFYNATAKTYIVAYPKTALGNAKKVSAYTPPILAGMEAGYVALYQKCVHLGCRVPWCQSSAVVRVPLPRLEVQQGRREGRWAGAARSRPVRARGLGRQHRGRHREPRARATDRHQHHQPEPGRPALCLTRSPRPGTSGSHAAVEALSA